MKVVGYLDYIQGYLRYGHYELELNIEEAEMFNNLSEKEQKEYLRDNGMLIVDDYSIDDIGDIYEIETTN